MTTSNGKTVLVTGATGGIGKAVCAELVAQGYSLILAARNVERLVATCDRLKKNLQQSFSFIPVDMSDRDSLKNFASALGSLNFALHGAVIMPPQIKRTEDCLPSAETWESIFNTSFIGPLEILKHALSTMTPDPSQGIRSKVVLISGVSSAQVLENYATSNTLRSMWKAQMKTLAFAYGPQGIHFNSLSLGGTLTDDYRASIADRAAKAGVSFEQRLAEETSNVPLRKYGTPEEVARSVAALLGPLSDHITGQNILHEGGFIKAY